LRGVYLPISPLRQVLVAFVESAILVTAFLVATELRLQPGLGELLWEGNALLKALVSALLIQTCFYYADLYERHAAGRRLEILLRVSQAFLVGIFAGTLVYYAVPALEVGRGILFIYVPLALGGIGAWRTLFLWVSGHEALAERILIVGTGASAQMIASEILEHPPHGIHISGFLGEQAAEVGRRLVNPTVIGTMGDLQETVKREGVNRIIVALDDRRGKMPVADLLRCRMGGVRIEEVTDFFERLTGKILLSNLRPSWLVFSPGFNKPRLLRNAKFTGEFALAFLLLVVLSPLIAVAALLVRLTSPGPVFYGQIRVGERGKTFRLFKFRTMRTDAEAATGPVWATEENDPRVTPIGRRLRKMRLDEIPQLLNVLRGEMSFVGPRPERPHFVESLRKVIPYYDERHSVKPGITGWAQIRFRYGSTIEDAEEKLQYDLYYIKHMSLIFDLAIVLDTLKVALLSKGAR
jgi:sugar transferase (PEP-CTERM system associated)